MRLVQVRRRSAFPDVVAERLISLYGDRSRVSSIGSRRSSSTSSPGRNFDQRPFTTLPNIPLGI
jgi:hypothetical protein